MMEIKPQRSKLERRKGNKKNNRTERAIVEKKYRQMQRDVKRKKKNTL